MRFTYIVRVTLWLFIAALKSSSTVFNCVFIFRLALSKEIKKIPIIVLRHAYQCPVFESSSLLQNVATTLRTFLRTTFIMFIFPLIFYLIFNVTDCTCIFTAAM